jgi:hypothetical protein
MPRHHHYEPVPRLRNDFGMCGVEHRSLLWRHRGLAKTAILEHHNANGTRAACSFVATFQPSRGLTEAKATLNRSCAKTQKRFRQVWSRASQSIVAPQRPLYGHGPTAGSPTALLRLHLALKVSLRDLHKRVILVALSGKARRSVKRPRQKVFFVCSYKSRAARIPESRSTRTWGWICWIRSLSDVAETWWDAGGIYFACPDTDSFSARGQNREEPLPARYAHYCICACSCHVCCGFIFLL